VGEERLRITPTPGHTTEQLERLIKAVDEIFDRLNIKRLSAWKEAGGRAGVGVDDKDHVQPVWNEHQLGLKDNTAPKTLRKGMKANVDGTAANHAENRLAHLLGGSFASEGHSQGKYDSNYGFKSHYGAPAMRPVAVGA
jgi:5-aminolevulinate synthase